MDELQKCVVGAQDPDGSVVFQYGWTRKITTKREGWEAYGPVGVSWAGDEWTTSLHWARKPNSSRTYPTDADFAEALPEAQRALTAAPVVGE